MTCNFPTSYFTSGIMAGLQRGVEGWGFCLNNMSKKAKPLPMDAIRESLELDPASATHLRWKARPRHHFNLDRSWRHFNSQFAGRAAGTAVTNGCGRTYWVVWIGGAPYKAHRIVYALAYGADPAKLQVDHRDGDSLNNNPSNLRLATQSENMHNQGVRRNNTSGRKGVHWSRRSKKWHASIGIHGHLRHLGFFDSLDAAAAAYAAAAEALHGEFARTA